jgi:hypothetical protein
VADRKDVAAFFGDLIRRRRGPVIVLLTLHALAAIAGLVVPRILGRLVDQAAAGGNAGRDPERAHPGRHRGGAGPRR